MKTTLALGTVTFLLAACGELADPPTPVGAPDGTTVQNPSDPVDPPDVHR